MMNPFHPVISAARRVLCAIGGHDTLLHIEPNRISLRCVTCGHESTGWTVGEPVPGDACAMRPGRHAKASHAEASHAI